MQIPNIFKKKRKNSFQDRLKKIYIALCIVALAPLILVLLHCNTNAVGLTFILTPDVVEPTQLSGNMVTNVTWFVVPYKIILRNFTKFELVTKLRPGVAFVFYDSKSISPVDIIVHSGKTVFTNIAYRLKRIGISSLAELTNVNDRRAKLLLVYQYVIHKAARAVILCDSNAVLNHISALCINKTTTPEDLLSYKHAKLQYSTQSVEPLHMQNIDQSNKVSQIYWLKQNLYDYLTRESHSEVSITSDQLAVHAVLRTVQHSAFWTLFTSIFHGRNSTLEIDISILLSALQNTSTVLIGQKPDSGQSYPYPIKYSMLIQRIVAELVALVNNHNSHKDRTQDTEGMVSNKPSRSRNSFNQRYKIDVPLERMVLDVINNFFVNRRLVSKGEHSLIKHWYDDLYTLPRKTKDKWPYFEIFITIGSNNQGLLEFKEMFIRTLLFFWPLEHTNILVVLDGENKNSTRVYNEVLNSTTMLNSTQIRWNNPSAVYGNRRVGWYRQQWLMFWADNFTDSEYVAFTDSDAIATTIPCAEDFFEDGKPVVIAESGKKRRLWTARTIWTMKSDEILQCMTYFPVMIKLKHIIAVRSYLTALHKYRRFDEFYFELQKKEFSQFHIWCNYLWRFHRNDYTWHIEIPRRWYGAEKLEELSENGMTAAILYPKPRVFAHFLYTRFRHPSVDYFMRKGYCYALRSNITKPATCKQFQNKDYNEEMFRFERRDWQLHPKFFEAYNRRLERLHKSGYQHQWDQMELKRLNIF